MSYPLHSLSIIISRPQGIVAISFTLILSSVLAPQVLLGWKYGDGVDEKSKIHPQLRIYKALTEKVQNVRFVQKENKETE